MDSTPLYDFQSMPWDPGMLSLAVYAILVIGVVGALLFLSSWVGERKEAPEKATPYECGIIPTDPSQLRYPAPFYLVAIFFLIFDVEAAFILAWAVAFEEVGWIGWLEILFFVLVLLLCLVYVWKKGGLEWGPARSGKAEQRQT
jgi:NADH-quinone oxidoreductase subunit A